MTFTLEHEVPVPPEVAFDVLADVRNETLWNPHVTRAELVSDEPIGQGTRFLTVNRGYEYTARISIHRRPEHLEFVVTGKTMDIDARFRFAAPRPNTTRIAAAFDMHPKGVLKLLFPLFAPAVRRGFPKQFAEFSRLCRQRESTAENTVRQRQ